MNGRAAELGTWQVDRGSLGPVVAGLVIAGTVPFFFDYIPDGAPLFGLWAAILFGFGWSLCGLAPAATVSRCRTLFTVSFAVRVVVVILLVHFDFWQDDEILYHSRAQLIGVADILKTPMELWDLGILRYAVVCQAIYRLLGYDTIGPRILNVCLGSLIPVTVYLIARRQEDRPWAVHAGWLVALYPNLVLYSGFELKDIGVAFGVTVFLLGLMEREHSASPVGRWGLILVGGGVACFLRFFLAAPLALGLWWKLLEGGRGVARRAIIAGGLFLLVDLLLLFLAPEASLLHRLHGTMSDLHSSMFGIGGVDDRSFFNGFAGGYTPITVGLGFLYIFLVPFIVWPFTVDGAIYKMIAPGIFVWYAVMPLVPRGAFHLEGKATRAVLAVTAGVLAGLTLGGGFHATGRHRIMIMPILLMYAARGFDDLRRGDRMARRLAYGYAVALALGLAYYCSAKGL